MKCLIIDDEPLAQEVIENYCKTTGQIKVLAKFDNAIEALTAIPKLSPDLLFLDIQMPQLTGLDFLKTLKNPPLVIITTAYREFALEGFELDVLDYLVKPIEFPRFMKSVSKAFRQLGLETASVLPLESSTSTNVGFIYVKVDKMMQKVLLDDLLFVESLKNYVKIHTEKDIIITYLTLRDMEEKLPASQFLRIHRSFIIDTTKVNRYAANFVEIGKVQIPIGGNYRQVFEARFKDNT